MNQYTEELEARAEAILAPRLYRSIDHGLRTADDTARLIIETTIHAHREVSGLAPDAPVPGFDGVDDLLSHDGWEDDPDDSQALYDASWCAECNPPEGWAWVTSADCGMSWLYNLSDLSDGDRETIDEYLEGVQ